MHVSELELGWVAALVPLWPLLAFVTLGGTMLLHRAPGERAIVLERYDRVTRSDGSVLRVHQEDVPLPYAANLEALSLPGVDKIVAAVKTVTAREG